MVWSVLTRRGVHLVGPGVTFVHDLTEGLTVDGLPAVAGTTEPVVVLQNLPTAQLGLPHQELEVRLVQVRSQARPAGPPSSLLVSHDVISTTIWIRKTNVANSYIATGYIML